MSQSEEKILSALLDGIQENASKSERDRLLTEGLDLLDSNAEVKSSFRRQHLLKSLLRGDTDGLTQSMATGELQQRTMQAITDIATESDPTTSVHSPSSDTVVAINAHLSADRNNTSTGASTGNLTHDELHPDSPQTVATASNDDVTWRKPAATFAVAASIVAAALFTWYPADLDPDKLPAGQPVAVVDQPMKEPLLADVFEQDAGFSTPGTRWATVSVDDGGVSIGQTVDMAGQSYLNALLVEHGSAAAINGLSTYAKFVGFDVSSNR